MSERLDESGIESTTVSIMRTSATVKGGRRFSFAALVVVGDRQGSIGLGHQKSGQVPQAIEKSTYSVASKVIEAVFHVSTSNIMIHLNVFFIMSFSCKVFFL